MEPLSFWMYNSSLVREQPKGTGQTMGWLQLAKPAPLVGERQWQQDREGSGSSKESVAVAERRGRWWQEGEWVPWAGWRWSVERRGHVGWQGGSVGKESTQWGCLTVADRGWVGSRKFCGAMHAQCACECNKWQWDGGWRGWWQQDREGGGNRKESMVAERRVPWRQVP